MSSSTSTSSARTLNVTRLWAEAAAIADAAGEWPRQLRVSLADFGQHPRRQAGSGADFWQYRNLSPGEAISRVDWRKSGRTDALMVRDQEREVPARLFLWCDQSPSMHYASRPKVRSKAEWAFVLAASLTQAANAAGERVAALEAGPSGRGASRMRELMPNMTTPPAIATVPDHSLIVIISDCLGLMSWLAKLVAAVARARSRLVVIQVHDPAEAEFPFTGRVEFTGMEGEKTCDIDDARSARDTYLAAWSEFQNNLNKTIQVHDNIYLSLSTEASPADGFAALVNRLGMF